MTYTTVSWQIFRFIKSTLLYMNNDLCQIIVMPKHKTYLQFFTQYGHMIELC